jgi:hypothetical protein
VASSYNYPRCPVASLLSLRIHSLVAAPHSLGVSRRPCPVARVRGAVRPVSRRHHQTRRKPVRGHGHHLTEFRCKPSRHGPHSRPCRASDLPMRCNRDRGRLGLSDGAREKNRTQPSESILQALRQCHKALQRGTACLCPRRALIRPSQLKEESAPEKCAWIKVSMTPHQIKSTSAGIFAKRWSPPGCLVDTAAQ